MKNLFITFTLLCLCCGLNAQHSTPTPQEMQRKARQRFHQKDASQLHLQRTFPLYAAPKTRAEKENSGLQLPQDNWFPGEWEEVQAIVVTCLYNYLVPGHEKSYSWYADPVVSGFAYYMNYDYDLEDWVQKGSGAYLSSIDTLSNSGKVFFYVMDAIQSGNAEAWVRIEKSADSNVVLRQLKRMNLRHDHLRFLIGSGNSFWFRDCGPICFYYGSQDSVAMLDFMYYSGRALDDSLPTLIEKQMGLPNYITSIEWEGGNCIVDGAGMVLSSDAIYIGNEDEYGQLFWDGIDTNTIYYEEKEPLTAQQVRDSLAHLMGSRATYVIPSLKFDGGTGHVDLYADMLDENSFVFSKYPEYCKRWSDYKTANRNIETLTGYQSLFGNNFKRSFIPFPCDEDGNNFASQVDYDDFYSRSYSNHTFVNNVIIQPCFSTVRDQMPTAEWDRQRIEKVKEAYPGYTIYPIDVSSFDGQGGAIHCITKQIPADNPVRILHPSITGNTDSNFANKNVPVTAKVTNRSGIDKVSVFWRLEEGAWQQTELTPGDNDLFDGELPLSSATYSDYAKVEYYLSATSNNGKTITKPMTASQGGYYTFYLGHNPDARIRESLEANVGLFYPNPTRQSASITLHMAEGTRYQVRLLSTDGRLTPLPDATASGTYQLNVSGWSSGRYYVVFIDTEGGKVVRSLVVE